MTKEFEKLLEEFYCNLEELMGEDITEEKFIHLCVNALISINVCQARARRKGEKAKIISLKDVKAPTLEEIAIDLHAKALTLAIISNELKTTDINDVETVKQYRGHILSLTNYVNELNIQSIGRLLNKAAESKEA